MVDDEPVEKKSRKNRLSFRYTARAPVNIAVIKYWGKRDDKLILPVNSSLSVTLNQEERDSLIHGLNIILTLFLCWVKEYSGEGLTSKASLCTTTTVVASADFSSDSLWINGREQPIADAPRIQNCLSRIRDKCRLESPQRWQELKNCNLHIASKNNFPTAAGLASSASGHACLVFLLAKLFHLKCELSGLARQGSGSACRSMYGGFVVWLKGEHEDGMDSIAKQIMPADHWPSLRILILVVNDQKKSTSSTEGMKRSVETSELLQLRATYCVPQRMIDMEQAIINKDFKTFAELTMKESNQFHAVCQDTYPPIEPPFLSTTSHNIIQLVTAYNQHHKNAKVAYTFDAGPNAVLFVQEEDVPEMVAVIQHFFPPQDTKGFIKGIPIQEIPKLSKDLLGTMTINPFASSIKHIISTKVGSGPSMINMDNEHLLNENGSPP